MPGSNIFTGTLELLILQTLKWGPRHGYAIGRWISQRTGGAYDLEEGVLYPALYRLHKKGLLVGRWGETESGRRARFYSLSKKGQKALERETARWQDHVEAVGAVLEFREG